jgi:signal transduction histidine kinase
MKSRGPEQPTAERTATDEGLRAERRRTDDKLTRTRAEHDEDVDRILGDARARTEQAFQSACGDDAGNEAPRDVVGHDITRLLRRERGETDELLLLERIRADAVVGSRDDFLAIVSHDLRGMLNGIAMSVALLTRLDADPRTREAISTGARRIERFIARMNRLIGDLLDVSRLDAGKLEIILASDDPAKLLEEAVDNARPLAAANNIALYWHAPVEPIRAFYDRERIHQVLANLIGNALKFTGAGGRTDVSVEGDPDEVRFTVADTGCGIPEEKLAGIFDRFSQGEKPDRTGFGLGLYIARRIVEAHGGRVWVESQPQKGSAFHFALPATPQRAPGNDT